MNNSGYFLLTGPTGVGKSSVISQLSTYIESIVFPDPYIDNPFISDAYLANNMCFQSQVFFFKEFFKIHLEINDISRNNIVIQERSIFESVYIFCRNLYIEGIFSKNEYNLMQELLSTTQQFIKKPKTVFFLFADSSVILERIIDRARSFERNLSLEFVDRQLELYQDWINSISSIWDCDIVKIDTSFIPVDSIAQRIEGIIKNHTYIL